ncbi:MAG TPA: SusD/RagB family nutrient-binding outer membrane lipoprotein [Fulvivirga sp.]|nr:SusD/RagB family nutrient-binding outer membrane lipoprotein [Fulvivirga sp.]
MRNIFKSILAAFGVVLIMSACTNDFEEINTNPNGPVVVPSDLLLGSIQEATADRLYSTFVGGDMGETWIQHWGKVQYNDEERYDVRPGVINSTWNGFYAEGLVDAKAMYELAQAEGNRKNMGVSLVMKAYIFSVLTEMYGSIPYTEALQGAASNTTPIYNSQDVVYDSLLNDINRALPLLDGEGTISSTQDLMYAGDALKWKKFANSLKFRMLMRISAKRNVSADLQAIVNSGVFMTSNADNAQLKYTGVNPNANPIWNTVVFGTRNEWKINETIVTMMSGLNDPRLNVYAQPNSDGDIRGVAPGINNPVQSGYDYDNVSALGEYFLAPDLPATFMSNSELKFLMAEAAVKGFITGVVAQDMFNAGIRASFATYNGFVNEDGSLVAMDPEAYILSLGYTPANALVNIATQNYLALYSQGVEAWTEWRRTKIPVLSPAIDPKGGINEIPSRYFYPTDEQTLNSANYSAASAEIGGDQLTTKLWFMQ